MWAGQPTVGSVITGQVSGLGLKRKQAEQDIEARQKAVFPYSHHFSFCLLGNLTRPFLSKRLLVVELYHSNRKETKISINTRVFVVCANFSQASCPMSLQIFWPFPSMCLTSNDTNSGCSHTFHKLEAQMDIGSS